MAGVQAGRLEIEIVAEIAKLQDDMRKVERSVSGMASNVGKSVNAANDNFDRMGKGSRLAGHHIQNLAFQFQDLGVQIASGSNPLTAFIQQGSQISGIMMQAGVGVGGMTKQLAGAVGRFAMAHPVMLAVAAAAGTGALAFKGFADTLENKAPVDDYIKSLGLTAEEAKKLEGAHVTLGDAAGAAWDMIKEALGLEDVFATVKGWVSDTAKWLYDQFWDATASIYAAFAATYDNIGLIWKNLPALMRDAVVLAVNRTITGLQDMANAAITVMNTVSRGMNSVIGTSIPVIPKIDLSGALHEYSAAGKAVAAAFAKSYRGHISEVMGVKGEFEDRALGNRNARIDAQADALIKDRKDKTSKAAKAQADEEAKLAKWLADTRMEAQGNVFKLAQDMAKRQQEWGKDEITVGETMIQQAKDLEALEEARAQGARETLDIYLQQLDAIARMGGAFGTIAGLLEGMETGNFAGVGGKFGALLGMPVGGTVERDGRVFAKTLGDSLKDVFGKDSEFFKGLSSVLADAGMGSLAGGMFGMNSKTEQFGSAIGGAIGGKVGEKFLSKGFESIAKGLGDFAGPLGSIVGGLLGGVVGGLLKKTKWGAVDLSASGAGMARGNSGAAEKAAVSMGENVFASLNQIAEAFGGQIGEFGNITIGQRDGDWRVNTGGTSLKTKNGAMEFNDDAEGAIAFAIQTAIERGAITGIRASTQNLLKASSDLQTKLSKALAFEGVFTELRSMLDPTAYALESLTKQFDDLREIFKEASATTEEYAQLEQLLALKRKNILDEQAQQVIDDLSGQNAQEVRFLELLGKESEALSLARMHELAAMKDARRPMQAMIYQLEDARAIIEKFGPLATGLKAFKEELLGGTAANSFAFLSGKFRDTAASARMGDADALGALQSDANAFLEAAQANARSELDYRRALGEVLAATDGGIFAAESQVEYAQLQIDAMAANTNVLAEIKSEMATYQQRLIEQGEWVQREFRRWSSEGLRIQNDPTSPVYTEAAA